MTLNRTMAVTLGLSCLVSLSTPRQASAEEFYTLYTTVELVQIDRDMLQVKLVDVINPASCENGAGWYFKNFDSTGTKEMYSMLLAAKLSNSEVQIRVPNSECVSDFPTFDFVRIK